LKGRRRTRLSLEACSTPPAVNYGHVGLKDSSYILVNFNEKERKELNSAIYKLSNGCKNFKLVQNAKCHTTHCFIKGKSKTVQIYKSLAYGAYILTAEFVKDSLAAGHWLDPKDFEVDHFIPRDIRVKNNQKLFKSRVFFVSPDTSPKRMIIEQLIEFCGGSCSRMLDDRVNLIIGNTHSDGIQSLNEKWILDSIEAGVLKSSSSYTNANTSHFNSHLI